MNEQQRLFDGFSVTLVEGRFVGGFDLDDKVADDIAYDDMVTFVVTARVAGATFGATKSGDIKRTNNFQVTSASALDRGMAEKVLNSLGVAVNGVNSGQMAFPATQPVSADADEDGDGDVEVSTVASGEPVRDPLLRKFLNDEL